MQVYLPTLVQIKKKNKKSILHVGNTDTCTLYKGIIKYGQRCNLMFLMDNYLLFCLCKGILNFPYKFKLKRTVMLCNINNLPANFMQNT